MYIGTVAAKAGSQTTIYNVHVSGEVSGYTSVGGIVGQFGLIDPWGPPVGGNMYAVSFEGTNNCITEYCGGIVGDNHGGFISLATVDANILGGSDGSIGGIIGYNDHGTITESYFNGELTLGGGVVGLSSSGSIRNTFATPLNRIDYGGGILENAYGNLYFENNYWYDNPLSAVHSCSGDWFEYYCDYYSVELPEEEGGGTIQVPRFITDANGGKSYFYNFNNPPLSNWSISIWDSDTNNATFPRLRDNLTQEQVWDYLFFKYLD